MENANSENDRGRHLSSAAAILAQAQTGKHEPRGDLSGANQVPPMSGSPLGPQAYSTCATEQLAWLGLVHSKQTGLTVIVSIPGVRSLLFNANECFL